MIWQVDHRPMALSGDAEKPWQTISQTLRVFVMPWRVIIIVITLILIWIIYKNRLSYAFLHKKTEEKPVIPEAKADTPITENSVYVMIEKEEIVQISVAVEDEHRENNDKPEENTL